MGTCWNCETQLTLGEERTKCDLCGEILFYKCNSCREEFKIEDEKTKKKLKDCKICGYFVCPNCGTCSIGCKKYEWEEKILTILKDQTLTQKQQARAIREYIVTEKSGKEERICPERKVLISYAKTRMKGLLARAEGFRVKNEKDRDAFIKRVDEASEKPLGTELRISEIREAGSYGQEYRDALNTLVCMGKLKIIEKSFVENKKTIKYNVYVRCNEEPCPLLSRTDLVINECQNKNHKGKNKFSLDEEFCNTCPPKKGKGKGMLWKLKKRLNDKDVCQLYRGDFINR